MLKKLPPGDECSASPNNNFGNTFPHLFLFLSMTLCVVLSSAFLAVSLLSPLPTPSLLTGRGRVRKRRPGYCGTPAQQWLKHPCVINAVLATNPNHRTIQVAVEKINSVPGKTSKIGNPNVSKLE